MIFVLKFDQVRIRILLSLFMRADTCSYSCSVRIQSIARTFSFWTSSAYVLILVKIKSLCDLLLLLHSTKSWTFEVLLFEKKTNLKFYDDRKYYFLIEVFAFCFLFILIYWFKHNNHNFFFFISKMTTHVDDMIRCHEI